MAGKKAAAPKKGITRIDPTDWFVGMKNPSVQLMVYGVEISYIRGTTSGGNHGWNLVKLNGEWYHLDVTWNDAGGDRKTFYLVTDEFMRQSRAWDTSKYPKSSAVSYGS